MWKHITSDLHKPRSNTDWEKIGLDRDWGHEEYVKCADVFAAHMNAIPAYLCCT